jgi:hypothetical protein
VSKSRGEPTLLYKSSIYADLRQAWGVWLVELGDRVGGWDWWATLTFRDPPVGKIGVGYAKRAWKAFMEELRAYRGIGEPAWVRGMEYQHWRGVPHFHALLSGVKHLRRDSAWSWWFKNYGIARILPYDPQLGAGFYLCKYVVKELGEIEFSPNFEAEIEN